VARTRSGGHATQAHAAEILGWAGTERLGERLQQGSREARRVGRPVLVSVAGSAPALDDPVAVVAAARRPEDDWFCLQQPRGAVASLGCVHTLEATGDDRFARLQADWRALAGTAIADDLIGPPGAGLAAFGGFAFAPDGGAAPHWRGFSPGSLLVPELSLVRGDGETWLTVNAQIAPDDLPEERLRRLLERLATLRAAPLPLLDPLPTGRYELVSAMPPAHYEEAVKAAVARIRAGEFDKVVLAREVDVHAPAPYDPSAVLGVVRDAYSSSYVYAVGRGDTTFIGATPELLIRAEGQRVSTVALAGSTRRSADPAVDDHLGERLLRSDKDRHENAIVADRIVRALGPHALWVTGADELVVVKVANIQHLALPIRAQLAESMDVLELVGLLHPTPAVGAEPRSAVASIPGLEGFDRGWYAGAIGWTDAAGDGEFCVALRCALLAGSLARCYAGCGIVADSDAVAELAESEIKLQVMLPALTG
jgi:isochorismate synthase